MEVWMEFWVNRWKDGRRLDEWTVGARGRGRSDSRRIPHATPGCCRIPVIDMFNRNLT